MGDKPYIINVGGFLLVVPEGKVLKFTRLGIDPGYDVARIPPVIGPTTLVLQALPVLDVNGHQYAIDMTWMEDDKKSPLTTKDPRELAARDAAILEYARTSHILVDELLEYKSVVPARLDRPYPCDYGDCKGWHFLPKNFYTQAAVDAGWVPAEVLEWQ